MPHLTYLWRCSWLPLPPVFIPPMLIRGRVLYSPHSRHHHNHQNLSHGIGDRTRAGKFSVTCSTRIKRRRSSPLHGPCTRGRYTSLSESHSQSQFIYRPPLPPRLVSKDLPNLWRIPPE